MIRFRRIPWAWLGVALGCCARAKPRTVPATDSEPGPGPSSQLATSALAPSAAVSQNALTVERGRSRVIRFAWRPPGGAENEYDMRDPADQHQLLLLRGVAPEGGKYPVVIGLHGQPRRGQAPRSYAFAPAVILVSETAVSKGATPFVLALPVFRYRGTNWPAFDLAAFRIKLGALLEAEHIQATEYYVFGHSGAAGCGGDGMNRAHRISPAAVGFFDTCIGPGWAAEVRALRAAQIPTLVIHSVETAGFNPRPAQEYMANFDFGHAYA
ncbi:MAG TPA: hypothetical protein VGJ84_22640, partial [Polyangiaceae bacterium]